MKYLILREDSVVLWLSDVEPVAAFDDSIPPVQIGYAVGDKVVAVTGGSVVQVPNSTTVTAPYIANRWTGNAIEVNPDYMDPATTADPWADLRPIPSDGFIALVAQAITPPRWARLRNDPMAQWIWDVVMAPTMAVIDPNDKNGNFRSMLAYLRSTDGQDSQVLMTASEEAAIQAAWQAKFS